MQDVTIKDKATADFTRGSVIGAIAKMGLPSMIGFMSGHLYSLADMYWLANLPERETAVAAVTIFSNIFWFFFSFNQLIGTGSVALISRRYGEKDFDRAETAIKETFLLKWTFAMVFGIIGYFFVEEMLYLAGARGEAIQMGADCWAIHCANGHSRRGHSNGGRLRPRYVSGYGVFILCLFRLYRYARYCQSQYGHVHHAWLDHTECNS